MLAYRRAFRGVNTVGDHVLHIGTIHHLPRSLVIPYCAAGTAWITTECRCQLQGQITATMSAAWVTSLH